MNNYGARQSAFIYLEVLVELVWVLERSYRYSRNVITAAVMGLIPAAELHVKTAQDFAKILPL